MIDDREKTQLQETGEAYIDPRMSVGDVIEMVYDLGLDPFTEATYGACSGTFGVGLVVKCHRADPMTCSKCGESPKKGDPHVCLQLPIQDGCQ